MAHVPDDEGDGWGEQSRFAAHLDRGWTLLQRGDVSTARAAAQHALDARPEAPEALLLMGAVAVAEDRTADAEEYFQRATELDPEYPEPYVELAHLLAFHAKRPLDAIDVVDTALELDTLSPIERLDLGVLGLEAAVLANDPRTAKGRLRALEGLSDLRDLLEAPPGRASDEDDDEREALLRLHGDWGSEGAEEDDAEDDADAPGDPDDDELGETFHRAIGAALRLARVLVDVGDAGSAADWLRATVVRVPDEAEGWHLLGDVELLLGNAKAAALAAVQTLRLDLRAPLPAWVPSPATIQRRTLERLATIEHPQVRAADGRGGTDVLVIVQECPSPELLVEGVDPRVPLLSLAGRSPSGDSTVLTGIAVYRRNLALLSADLEDFWSNLEFELDEELAVALPVSPQPASKKPRGSKAKPSGPARRARSGADLPEAAAVAPSAALDDATPVTSEPRTGDLPDPTPRAATGKRAQKPATVGDEPTTPRRRKTPRLLS